MTLEDCIGGIGWLSVVIIVVATLGMAWFICRVGSDT